MKKFYIFAMALVVSAFAIAADPAYVEIELTGATGGSSSVYLYEDNGYTNAYESGADVEKFMSFSNSKSVLLYGLVDSYKCEDVVTNNLDGQVLGFATNQVDANYTLKFIDFEGRTLKLYDLVTNTETVITDGGTYDFTVEAAQVGRHQINDRFVINYVAPVVVTTVTTNAYGFASFSYTEDLKLATAGAKLYTGAISGEALDMTEVDYVKAGEGVIVKGAANTTYNLVAGTGSSVYGVNALIASANWTVSTEDAYFLVGNEFKKYTGTEAVPAGKAYLIYTTTGGANPAPARIVMRFNTTTAVENVEAEAVQPVKFIENGEIFIRRGNEVYNLQGQLVK